MAVPLLWIKFCCSKDHIDIECKEGKQSLILGLSVFVEDIDLDVRGWHLSLSMLVKFISPDGI